MKGNDGKKYKSVADSRGVYKWVAAAGTGTTRKRSGKSYEIIDNYARPFTVFLKSGNVAEIITAADGKTILTTPYKHAYIGDNDLRDNHYAPRGDHPGNSILLHVSPQKYIYVGEQIYSFAPLDGDTIKAYYSPLGNNQVPYPYAVGEKYVYFMGDKVAVEADALDLKADGYSQFYKLGSALKSRPFTVKVIKHRIVG